MSFFKHKPTKVKYLTNVVTLDEMHRKYANDFFNDRKTLPLKKKKLDKLLDDLDKINTNKEVIDVEKKAKIMDEIDDLKNKIFDIENNMSELEYYSKINDVVMEYYKDNENITVKKEEQSEDDKLKQLNLISQKNRKAKKETKKRIKTLVQKPQIDIISYLTCGKQSLSKDDSKDSKNSNPPNTNNKASLYEEFLSRIDCGYSVSRRKKKIIKMCENCNIEKIREIIYKLTIQDISENKICKDISLKLDDGILEPLEIVHIVMGALTGITLLVNKSNLFTNSLNLIISSNSIL
jgi:hypothetical protein